MVLSLNRPMIQTIMSSIHLIILAAMIYPLTIKFGILGTSMAVVASFVIILIPAQIINCRLIKLKFRKWLQTLSPIMIACFTMVGTILSIGPYLRHDSIIKFILLGTLGLFIYFASIFSLRKDYIERVKGILNRLKNQRVRDSKTKGTARIPAAKLNIGCGRQILSDYINIDIRPLDNIDLIADSRSLPFKENSVDEIRHSHLIEHFTQAEMMNHIAPHWFDLLKPGGFMRVICPDWDEMIRRYVSGEYPFKDLRTVTFAGQDYEQNFHYNAFNFSSLKEALENVGFRHVTLIDTRRVERCWEMEVVAWKPTKEKLKVLLIPDTWKWITGTIGKQIIKCHPEFEFFKFAGINIVKSKERSKELLARVDVVHWLTQTEYLKHLDCMRLLKPTVFSLYHVVAWNQELRRGCDAADIIMVISDEWRQYLQQKGIAPEKIVKAPLGVDMQIFTPPLDKRRLREKYGVPTDAFVIGFFGKKTSDYQDRKGVSVFIEAVSKLYQLNGCVFVLLVGPGWGRLEKRLTEKGITHLHRVIPNHDKMPEMYGLLDVYLITSLVEGGPATLLESMSCGVPVISTKVGLAKEIIIEGHNGFLNPEVHFL